MTTAIPADADRDYFHVPDSFIDEMTSDLEGHFPWGNWKKYVKDILIDEKTPVGKSSDERIRYYLVVLETIARGRYDLLPFIGLHRVPSDTLRFFSGLTLGLDPEGPNEETVQETKIRLSRTFQKVSVLDKSKKGPLPDLILTTRDPRALYNDFPGALPTSVLEKLSPIVFQVPVVTQEENVSLNDGANPFQVALQRALEKVKLKPGQTEKFLKLSDGRGGKTKFRVEQKPGEAQKLFRVGDEPIDMGVFNEFSNGLLFPSLFPTSTLSYRVQQDRMIAANNRGMWKDIPSRCGWSVDGQDDALLEGKLTKSFSVARQVIAAGIGCVDTDRAAQMVYNMALNALAGEVARRPDHPNLKSITDVINDQSCSLEAA